MILIVWWSDSPVTSRHGSLRIFATHDANPGAERWRRPRVLLITALTPRYDCVVISDLHLGSDVCQAKLLEEFLIWAVEHCDELVINGDVFDDLNFKRLTKRHFACLKVIRRNSDRDDFRLVWVRGNHDGPIDIISHIVGVEILDEYVYDNGRIKLLILHGDQFDTFTTAYPWLTEIACGIFYYIQKWMPHRGSPMDSPYLEAVAAK